MQGKRLYLKPGEEYAVCSPGDYYLDRKGHWRGVTPNGLPVWLRNHKVIEHEYGIISVPQPKSGEPANSILAVYVGELTNKQWHGYINHGIWEEC